MFNYYFETSPKKETQLPKQTLNPVDIIEKAEDLNSRWVTEGLEPKPSGQRKSTQKSVIKK